MSTVRLTDTSYAVLGLLEQFEPATPYDLKRVAQISIFNFWSMPHTQIYKECERLAEGGLLDEQREECGRRRRFYRMTPQGKKALEKWRGETTEQLYEARDPALLRLFLGGDPPGLAAAQIAAHQRKLEELKEIAKAKDELPRGMRLALEMGISHEKELLRSWRRLEKEPEG